jgi:hypothetical protein
MIGIWLEGVLGEGRRCVARARMARSEKKWNDGGRHSDSLRPPGKELSITKRNGRCRYPSLAETPLLKSRGTVAARWASSRSSIIRPWGLSLINFS